MRHVHLPVWLSTSTVPYMLPLAALFSLESLARATMITVVPLQANRLFGGDKVSVSIFFFAIAIFGVLGSFVFPLLLRRWRRRWVITLTALIAVTGVGLMSLGEMEFFVPGVALRLMGTVGTDIVLSLFIIELIPKKQIPRFEPIRLFLSATSWTLGPWLGVFLRDTVDFSAPFILTMLTSLSTLALFWLLRIKEHPALINTGKTRPNPLKYLGRFFTQPRLRLAWLLAAGRSGWWVMFFNYGPLYALEKGVDEQTAGLIISAGTASLFVAPLWTWLGRRRGLRWLLTLGYGATAIVTIVVAVPDHAAMVTAMLIASAFAAGSIDGAGNIAFLRAVHPYERPEMTTVYSTYRDASQIVPPAIFTGLLKLFPMPAVFISASLGMLVLSFYCRFLPRRM